MKINSLGPFLHVWQRRAKVALDLGINKTRSQHSSQTYSSRFLPTFLSFTEGFSLPCVLLSLPCLSPLARLSPAVDVLRSRTEQH